MKNSGEYTPRVTRGEDGAYRWTYRISRKQHRHGLRVTMIVVGALCLLLVILGAMLDRQVFLITLLSCGAVMLITVLICWWFDRMAKGGVWQPFEMTEAYIRWVGYGRTDFIFPYRSLRSARILADEDIIEVRQRLGVMQVYVPHEDFGFVQDFILRRLPETAAVDYE